MSRIPMPASALAVALASFAAFAAFAAFGPLVGTAAAAGWNVPLTVHGSGSYAVGGVPFPRGVLQPDEPVRATGGALVATETLATWGDGSVRWLLVEIYGGGGTRWLEAGEGTNAPGVSRPSIAAGDFELVLDGVKVDLGAADWKVERESGLSVRMRAEGTHPSGLRWSARLTKVPGAAPERLRLELRNPRPTSTTANGNQPACMVLGCEGTVPFARAALLVKGRPARVRWSEENGCATIEGGVALAPGPMELRPGEQFGWEIVLGAGPTDPPLLEYPASWACSTRAAGPLVPVNSSLFGDYERNNVAGALGLRANRDRPHWRNPREHGEDQRDWDGGDVDVDFQTHNNEYEAILTYAKQRLRTMGDHATSRDWHYLGETCARHFANVDLYHVHEGPLRWMHGSAFQHVKHGGSGQGSRHRSTYAPNMAHQTGRGLLAWYYLTGDPLLLESFGEVAESVWWRVVNGPAGPGFSNTNGEERAPANALGLMTDSWLHTGNPKYLEAARKVVRDSHASTKDYIRNPDGREWRAKPWMVAMLVVTLDEFIDACEEQGIGPHADEARESAGLYRTFLQRWIVPDGLYTRLPYQVSNDPEKLIDDSVSSWNVVSADALVEFYPESAAALFKSGSHCIWYTGHPVGKYAKVINHIVMSGWGQRYMEVVAEEASRERAAAVEASAAAGEAASAGDD